MLDTVKKDILFCKENSPNYLTSSVDGEHKNFKILRDKIGIQGDYVFWHIEMMNIECDGGIFWDEEQKFYGDKELVNYLKDKVTDGDLLFFGEDGESWGYRFDGKGNFKLLKCVWVEK